MWQLATMILEVTSAMWLEVVFIYLVLIGVAHVSHIRLLRSVPIARNFQIDPAASMDL